VLRLRALEPDERAGFAASGAFVRGAMLRITGEVLDDAGRGAGGLSVEVHVRGEHGPARLLGTTVTRDDGGFTLRAVLPANTSAGEYDVSASTPGDATHEPARGE
jgi:hypothetical protein